MPGRSSCKKVYCAPGMAWTLYNQESYLWHVAEFHQVQAVVPADEDAVLEFKVKEASEIASEES